MRHHIHRVDQFYKVRCLIFNPFYCEINGYFDMSTCSGQCCKVGQPKMRLFLKAVHIEKSKFIVQLEVYQPSECAAFYKKLQILKLNPI